MMAAVADLAKRGDLGACLMLLRRPDSGTPECNVALRWLPVRKAVSVLDLMGERGIMPDRYTVLSMLHVLRHDRPRLDAALEALVARSVPSARRSPAGGSPAVAAPPAGTPAPTSSHSSMIPYFLWASVHADAGDPEGVLRVMAAAQAHGELLSDRYLTLLVKAYGFSGRVDEARVLVDELLEAGRVTCDPLIRALLNCFGRNGATTHLRELLARLDEAGVAPTADTYGAAVDALSECGDAEAAAALLERMRQDPRGQDVRSAYAYTSLAKALAARGDVAGVRRVLGEQAADGLPPNIYGYNCLVQACRVAGDLDGMRAALRDMRGAGTLPNAVTHGTVLGALAAAGDAGAALEYARSEEARGARDDLYFQTTLLRLLADAGRLDDARAVFEGLRGQHAVPDAVAFMALIDGLLQHWDRDRAARAPVLAEAHVLFEEMVGAGSFPLRLRKTATGDHLLDLHSHSPWTAQMATLRVVRDLAAERTGRQLQVVTGQGRRSPYAAGQEGEIRKARPIVRETVHRCLSRIAHIHRASWNPGLLLVPAGELHRLAKHKGGAQALYGPEAFAQWLVVPGKDVPCDKDSNLLSRV